MKPNIKLVGLDLDGTVLNDKRCITDKTREAIKQAMAKGVIVVPVTGRPISGVSQELLAAVPEIRYALCSNGAMIRDLQRGETIYQECIPYEQAQILMDEMMQSEIMTEPYINGEAYAQKSQLDQVKKYVLDVKFSEYFIKTRKAVDDICEYVREQRCDVEKIHLMFADQGLREEMKQKLEMDPRLIVTSANGKNLELNKSTVNKGRSLLKFGELFGIKKEEIMACGDSGNDLLMMKAVGLAVAMGNAIPEIKEAANYITKSNNEDGVAYAIEKFVLN